MVEQRSAGWYDDGNGRTRWWSGRGWTTHTQARPRERPAPAAVATAPAGTPDLARLTDRAPAVAVRRGFRGRTLLISAGAAAVLGIMIGASAGGGGAAPTVDPTAAPAYVALQTKLTSMVTERDALKAAASDASSRAADTADKAAAVDAAREALDARETLLDKREAKLDSRAKKLARSAAASTPAKAKTVTKVPSSVYYRNCDAARAAGAAPVRRGDPGYASHLDRDGDGVGCE